MFKEFCDFLVPVVSFRAIRRFFALADPFFAIAQQKRKLFEMRHELSEEFVKVNAKLDTLPYMSPL